MHWLGDSFCIQLNCRPPIKVVSETVDVSSCAFWPARTRQTQTHTYYMNHCTIVTKDHIAIVKIGHCLSGHKIYFAIGLSPQIIISYAFRNGNWLSDEKTIQRGFRMVPSERSVSYTTYSSQNKRSRIELSLSKGYMCH